MRQLWLGIAQPVLPLYLQNLGATVAVIGVVESARAIGLLLASLPSNSVLKRLTLRNAAALGCVIVSMALVSMFFARTIPAIFASWLVVGCGLSVYELARHQFQANYVANVFRGRAMAGLGGIHRLGSILGPAFGGWLASRFGFSAPFLVMAALFVCAAIVGFIALPNDHQTPKNQSAADARQGSILKTWQDNKGILAVAGSSMVLLQVIRRARPVLITLIAANLLGLGVEQIGIILSVGSMADTAMFLPAGQVMDRFGRKAAIIPSILLQSVGFLCLPITTGFATMTAAASLIGFGNGLSSGTMMTLGADLSPDDQRIAFLALWRMFSSTGFILGPNIVGVFSTLFALAPASILVGCIGFTAAGLFWRFVPETLRTEKEP